MRMVMMVLVAVAAPAAAQPVDWSSAETVTVGMKDFAFDPPALSLKAGQAYVLHFENRAQDGHEFTAKTFFAAAQVAPESRKVEKHGEVELKGGRSADVRLVAPAAGSFDLHCGKPGHAAMGMKGTIEVR